MGARCDCILMLPSDKKQAGARVWAGSMSHHAVLLPDCWSKTGPAQGWMVTQGNTKFVRVGISETHLSKEPVKSPILTPLCTALLDSAVHRVLSPLAWPTREKGSDSASPETKGRQFSHCERDPERQFVWGGGGGCREPHPHSQICLIMPSLYIMPRMIWKL